jgi:hypothetical protein
MKTPKWLGAAALGAATLISGGMSAQAGYIVTLTQEGPNVVAMGSGPIDLTGLSPQGGGQSEAFVHPMSAGINTGPISFVGSSFYSGYTGPTSFGSGGFTPASSDSGDIVGIGAFGIDLVVPSGYVSGNPLSDTSTYDNATFATLGVTPGTYVWSWGTGADADTFTLDIWPPRFRSRLRSLCSAPGSPASHSCVGDVRTADPSRTRNARRCGAASFVPYRRSPVMTMSTCRLPQTNRRASRLPSAERRSLRTSPAGSGSTRFWQLGASELSPWRLGFFVSMLLARRSNRTIAAPRRLTRVDIVHHRRIFLQVLRQLQILTKLLSFVARILERQQSESRTTLSKIFTAP